jgi:DNA-binding transcriptional regulator YhcF (GntR family)
LRGCTIEIPSRHRHSDTTTPIYIPVQWKPTLKEILHEIPVPNPSIIKNGLTELKKRGVIAADGNHGYYIM